jgi:pilus assembly protein Flp/PilA
MTKLIQRFLRCESGATAIEYGLIASLIAVVAITTLKGVGSKMNNKFSSVSNGVN